MAHEDRPSAIQEELVKTFTEAEIKRALILQEKFDTENPWFEIDLVVLGSTVAAGRPRNTAVWKGKGKEKKFAGTRTYDEPKSRDYKIELRKMVQMKLPDNWIPVLGPVEITVDVFKKMPNSASRMRMYLGETGAIQPPTKPDGDNYTKSVLDALNSVIWKDDAQCSGIYVNKWYSQKPRMEIHIEYRKHKMDV